MSSLPFSYLGGGAGAGRGVRGRGCAHSGRPDHGKQGWPRQLAAGGPPRRKPISIARASVGAGPHCILLPRLPPTHPSPASPCGPHHSPSTSSRRRKRSSSGRISTNWVMSLFTTERPPTCGPGAPGGEAAAAWRRHEGMWVKTAPGRPFESAAGGRVAGWLTGEASTQASEPMAACALFLPSTHLDLHRVGQHLPRQHLHLQGPAARSGQGQARLRGSVAGSTPGPGAGPALCSGFHSFPVAVGFLKLKHHHRASDTLRAPLYSPRRGRSARGGAPVAGRWPRT